MFSHILDRTLPWTGLYAAVCAAAWYASSKVPPLPLYGFLVVTTLLYLQKVMLAIQTERHCDSLGSRAPTIRTLTPFNVGLLFQALYMVVRHRNVELWWKMFRKNRNQYNPWTVEAIACNDRIIFTIDEDNIKAVLATQFQDFGKGEQFRREWKDFLGLSIFTTDGELWHNSRGLLRPQFVRDRVSDLHTFEKHVQVLLSKISEPGDGGVVQVDDLFYRFTLDAATEFLLGHSVDSLRNGQTDFAHAFGEVQRIQGLIARAGPLQQFVPRSSFFNGLKILNDFVNRYIERALQLSTEELEAVSKSDEGYTFLHALAAHTRDRTVLRDQIVAVLLAGRDTTAVTLSWLFYELGRHPHIVAKLREEMSRTLQQGQVPTYADLKSMRYLQHTLNETLRLYPVVPFNVRVALTDTTLPRGGGPDGRMPIAVPKDTPIGYSTLALHRRPDIYPPATEKSSFPPYLEFSPERWDSWTPRSWTYIPFNGGPRLCVGQQFALTEMAYTVVRILQTYSRIESRQSEFPGFKSDIVLQPARGVQVAFFREEI